MNEFLGGFLRYKKILCQTEILFDFIIKFDFIISFVSGFVVFRIQIHKYVIVLALKRLNLVFSVFQYINMGRIFQILFRIRI